MKRLFNAVPRRSFSTCLVQTMNQPQRFKNAVSPEDLKYALPPDPEKWTEGSRYDDYVLELEEGKFEFSDRYKEEKKNMGKKKKNET